MVETRLPQLKMWECQEKAVAEELVSVAFDYAIGKAATGESTKEFPTSEKAGGFDRDILGEMDVLPANPIVGRVTVKQNL